MEIRSATQEDFNAIGSVFTDKNHFLVVLVPEIVRIDVKFVAGYFDTIQGWLSNRSFA